VTLDSFRPELRCAIEAAQNKQAMDVTVLDLKDLSAFVEYFVLCTGTSDPQMQAIAREVEEQLGRRGVRLAHREGRPGSDWVLLDYGSFVVHIFSTRARLFYDLERLWRAAHRHNISPLGPTTPPSASGTAGQ
jgi:ribosome-associated protein